VAIEIRRTKKSRELIRTTWWCRLSVNGERTSYPLDVPIKGKPPASWIPSVEKWPMTDKGDVWFEKSRKEAAAAYERLKKNPPEHKTIDLGEAFDRGYKAQKHKKYRVIKVKDMLKFYAKAFSDAGHELSDTPYSRWKRNVVERFVAWWINTKRKAMTPVLEISVDDTRAFFEAMASETDDGKKITSSTLKRMRSHLKRTFSNLCPYIHTNPFDVYIKTTKDDEEVHREPLTEQEIPLVLAEAEKSDPLLYELIVTGLSTALRKGDICNLEWKYITDEKWDFNGKQQRGAIKLKTRKTGERVNCPIFPLFAKVLTKRLSGKKPSSKFVFPEAAALYAENPDALTDRIKRIFAVALADAKGADIEDAPTYSEVSPKEALPLVLEALKTAKLQRKNRENILRFLPLYAAGKTYRQIASEEHCNLSSISNAMKKAAEIANIRFVSSSNISQAKRSMNALIKKVTQAKRKVGLKAASLYDFPCLRTTFVTLAAKRGIPLETVRLITAHTDTRMLEQYYSRANALDVASTLAAGLPAVLLQDIPKPINQQDSKHLPALSKTPAVRAALLAQLKSFIQGLTAEEKIKLIN